MALAAEARGILNTAGHAKVAGLILTPDSRDAEPLRQAIATATGKQLPQGLMVGTVPRAMVEQLLLKMVKDRGWQEPSWQKQQVLPVVVSTRDGFKFGFFGLGAADAAGSD